MIFFLLSTFLLFKMSWKKKISLEVRCVRTRYYSILGDSKHQYDVAQLFFVNLGNAATHKVQSVFSLTDCKLILA